jgi:hypothetical protein
MQTNSPYPTPGPALGLLDPTPTLQTTPSIPLDIICTNLPALGFLLLADRLARLYEMVFPDHPEWLNEEVVDWEDEEDVAPAVERFLGRVSSLLFPVYDDIWDVDLEVVEWRLYEIPVMAMGYDEWYDGWDDLKEPAPYLLNMRHSRHNEDRPYRRNEFDELYPDHQVPCYLEPHCLVESLREICTESRSSECSPGGSQNIALPEPLGALPDLIEMLDHSTGNWWLDVGELSLADGGGYPPWNKEDMEWLAEEWRKAEPILERIHRLLNWQNNSPEELGFKLTAVRQALLDAYHRSQESAEQLETEVIV